MHGSNGPSLATCSRHFMYKPFIFSFCRYTKIVQHVLAFPESTEVVLLKYSRPSRAMLHISGIPNLTSTALNQSLGCSVKFTYEIITRPSDIIATIFNVDHHLPTVEGFNLAADVVFYILLPLGVMDRIDASTLSQL